MMNGSDKTGRLRAVIAAYGVDSARWPAAERRELRAAAQRHAEMQTALSHEAALDRVLRADAQQPDLPEGLRARILAAAPRPAPAAPPRRLFAAPAWLRAAGVALALGSGMVAGYAGAAAAFAPAGPEDSLLGMAFSSPGDPFAALMEDEA